MLKKLTALLLAAVMLITVGLVGGSYTAEAASENELIAAPSNVSAARYSYDKIKVTWSKVDGADGYAVYRSDSINGTYTVCKRVDGGDIISYINGSLTCGKTYYYKVRAYRNSDDTRVYGDYSSAAKGTAYIGRPTSFTVTESSYGLRLKWKGVLGVTGYNIYRATSENGRYTLLNTTASNVTEYANYSVVPGVTYYYKVVGVRNGTEGVVSEIKSGSPVLKAPSSPKAESVSADSIKLSWNGVSGATGYIVYRSTSQTGKYIEIARTADKSYKDGDLTLGRTYYYKVVPYRTVDKRTGEGTITDSFSAKVSLPAPAISSAKKNSATSIKISWSAVDGADGYYVYRAAVKDGTYINLGAVDADTLSFVDTGLTANKYYYYKVRAYKNVGSVPVRGDASAYKSGRITSKIAYLTFDDGPSSNTMKILDILDKYDVKATFFVIGRSGRDKEYKAIVDRGHTIALHSYTHDYSKVYASEKGFYNEMNRISDKIYSVTGVRTKILRFPGGSSNTVHRKYCSGLMAKLKKSVPAKGYYYHDWNVDSGDASGNNIAKSRLIANIKNGCKGQTVVNILMHDTGSAKRTTVEALPAIIEYLISQGFDIQPITEDSVLIQHK